MTAAMEMYVIVRGKDSPRDLPLMLDGKLVTSDGITRCDLVFRREGAADFVISSSTNPSWFSLQAPVTIDNTDLRIVQFNLRQISSPPSDGRYKVDVFLWDQDYQNGRLWGAIDAEIRPATPVPA